MSAKEEIINAFNVLENYKVLNFQNEVILDRDLFKKYFGEGVLLKSEFTTCDDWDFGYMAYTYGYRDLESGRTFISWEFGNGVKLEK